MRGNGGRKDARTLRLRRAGSQRPRRRAASWPRVRRRRVREGLRAARRRRGAGALDAPRSGGWCAPPTAGRASATPASRTRTSSAPRATPTISSATGCAPRRSAGSSPTGRCRSTRRCWPPPTPPTRSRTRTRATISCRAASCTSACRRRPCSSTAPASVVVRDFGLLTARVAPSWADDDRAGVCAALLRARAARGGRARRRSIDQRADVFASGRAPVRARRRAAGVRRAARAAASPSRSRRRHRADAPAAGGRSAVGAGARGARRGAAADGGGVPRQGAGAGRRARGGGAGDLGRARAAAAAGGGGAHLAARRRRRRAAPDGRSRSRRSPTTSSSSATAAFESAALPPPPSMLPSPVKWGGRPLLAPATATVWDPPSTTATTTLEALRRKRPRRWLRALVPLALAVTVVGTALVWQRVERTRARLAAAAQKEARPRAGRPGGYARQLDAAGRPPLRRRRRRAASTPGRAGAARRRAPRRRRRRGHGAVARAWSTPARPSAPSWRRPACRRRSRARPASSWSASRPGIWRVFVDGVDTGRTCPVEERIPLMPGPHRLTLYAPEWRSHRRDRAPGDGQGPRRLDAHYTDRGMTTILLLVVVAILIAAFSYFTNAGFGDRKPPKLRDDKRDQASATDDAPPPHK